MSLYEERNSHIFTYCLFLEALIGIEPTIRELQSLALPLGYRAYIIESNSLMAWVIFLSDNP